MNKGWDSSGIAYNVDLWRECLRVLKPGGHLLSFGGSRTYHRMACAIEDAGFEIRDQIQWIYGSGFPKSQNIGKAVDKAAGVEREVVGVRPSYRPNSGPQQNGEWFQDRSSGVLTKGDSEWEGWGSALKPAHEPIVLARKPLSEKTIAANVLKWGTGGINIDGCRVGTEEVKTHGKRNGTGTSLEWSKYKSDDNYSGGTHIGRFPANLIHDGSDEVVKGFPQTNGSGSKTGVRKAGSEFGQGSGWNNHNNVDTLRIGHADSGSAARFFYCAKASKAERNMGLTDKEEITVNDGRQKDIDNPYQRGITPRKNTHPTIKPISLMRYLCRLITPPNGIVLDPFAGSGSTLIAAKQEGFNYIGIEMEAEYIEIINARLSVSDDRQQTIFEGVQ